MVIEGYWKLKYYIFNGYKQKLLLQKYHLNISRILYYYTYNWLMTLRIRKGKK